MGAAGISIATAAAAAAARKKMEQEEQEMTNYSTQDLADDWEFKILRSAAGEFRDPVKLQQYLSEEKRAGWVLVEKFDDGRIRLKRPAAIKELDGKLDFDPYRSYVVPSVNKTGYIALCIALGIIAGLIVAVVVFVEMVMT